MFVVDMPVGNVWPLNEYQYYGPRFFAKLQYGVHRLDLKVILAMI